MLLRSDLASVEEPVSIRGLLPDRFPSLSSCCTGAHSLQGDTEMEELSRSSPPMEVGSSPAATGSSRRFISSFGCSQDRALLSDDVERRPDRLARSSQSMVPHGYVMPLARQCVLGSGSTLRPQERVRSGQRGRAPAAQKTLRALEELRAPQKTVEGPQRSSKDLLPCKDSEDSFFALFPQNGHIFAKTKSPGPEKTLHL